MTSRKNRREIERANDKEASRIARAAEANIGIIALISRFRELNAAVPGINQRIETAKSPLDTEKIMRELAENYTRSANVLSACVVELSRLNSIAGITQ